MLQPTKDDSHENECYEDESISKTKTSISSNEMWNAISILDADKNVTKENHNDSKDEKVLSKELEASSKGMIKGSLFVNYITSAKRPFTLAFLVVTFLLTQLLANMADIWVSYW